jgi:hypothetical protein
MQVKEDWTAAYVFGTVATVLGGTVSGAMNWSAVAMQGGLAVVIVLTCLLTLEWPDRRRR